MSSHDKDPQKKEDTSSESNKSSDGEIEEAEEDLGRLKIEKSAAKENKDVTDESKPPNREGISTSKLDLLNEPTPGPSGLQKPLQELLNEPVAGPSGLQKKIVKAKGIEEDIGAKMEEGEKSPSLSLSLESSSSRRYDNATDSGSTPEDVSEIRSEMAMGSREGSVYRDRLEDFMKDSPNYAPALERQTSSETSDTNISEIQDFVSPPTPESRSLSISTDTGEQGNRAYIDQLQREAAARGSPISTSSGIGSTDQSELAHQKNWILAAEMGCNEPNVDNRDHSDNVAEAGGPLPTSESMEEPNLADQMQEYDRLFEQAQRNVENEEEMNVPEDERGASARRSKVEKAVQASVKGAESPCKRRRQTKCPSDSVISEMEAIKNPRQKYKRNAGKKRKVASNQSHPVLQSSSESLEPKSSSSQELHRRESPDIESSSGAQEVSMTRRSERILRRQEHAMSSMDRVKGEVRTSPSRERDPGLMETEDHTPETISEKGDEGASEVTEASEAKPSTESTDQAYGSENDGTLKEHQGIFEDLGSERSVGKPKRERNLSNSPPSDEKPHSSAPKAATSRPKKRAKPEKKPGDQCSARHDSGGNVPKNVGIVNIKQGESKSSPDETDYTSSDDEKDTQS